MSAAFDYRKEMSLVVDRIEKMILLNISSELRLVMQL